MQKKKIILGAMALGALTIAGTLLFSRGTVFASDNKDTMIEKLAQKLGIDQAKVETAMKEIRDEDHVARDADQNTKLEQAVTDGVITEEQKAKLIEKREAMRTESKENMKQNREEMDQWMKDNGIDIEKIHDYLGGPRGGRGMGSGEGRGMRGDETSPDTSS